MSIARRNYHDRKAGFGLSISLAAPPPRRQAAARVSLEPAPPSALESLRIVGLLTPHLPEVLGSIVNSYLGSTPSAVQVGLVAAHLPPVLADIVGSYVRTRTPAEAGLQAILDVLKRNARGEARIQACLEAALGAFARSFAVLPRNDPGLQSALDDLSSEAPRLVSIIPDCAEILSVVFHAAERQPLEKIPAWPDSVYELCKRVPLGNSIDAGFGEHERRISESLRPIVALKSDPEGCEKIEGRIAMAASGCRRVLLLTWAEYLENPGNFTAKQILESFVPDLHVDGSEEAIRLSKRRGNRESIDPFALIASELVAGHLSEAHRADEQQLREMRDALDSRKNIYRPESEEDWVALSGALGGVRSRNVGAVLYAIVAGAKHLIDSAGYPQRVCATYAGQILEIITRLEKDKTQDCESLKSHLGRAMQLAEALTSDATQSPQTSRIASHALEKLMDRLFGQWPENHQFSGGANIDLLQCLVEALSCVPRPQGIPAPDSKSAEQAAPVRQSKPAEFERIH